MFSLIMFVLVLGVLVLSHEFGHFIVARRNGITVEEFGFGFPPRLLGIRRLKTADGTKIQIIWNKKQLEETVAHHTGTLYSVNLIPLGGFVRIKGESAIDPAAEEPDSYASKKTWQKAGVLSAGVLMNVLLAAVLLSIGYMIGMPAVGDDAGASARLQVVQVFPGKPAAEAGLKSGDQIVQIDNLKDPSVQVFQSYVDQHRNDDIAVTIEENGQTVVKKIRPTVLSETGKGGIGVSIVNVGYIRYPWYRAIYEGVVATGKYTVMIVVGLWYLLRGLFTGVSPQGAVAGPVGVAVLTGEAAKLGVTYLIQLMAILSLNLAILNVLPIPSLDGGRLFFLLWGKVFRRPVTPRIEQLIHAVGFVLLMFLVIIITINDVSVFRSAISAWWSRLFNF